MIDYDARLAVLIILNHLKANYFWSLFCSGWSTAVSIHVLQIELYDAFLLARFAPQLFFLLFPANIWKNARQRFMLRSRRWHNAMNLHARGAQILIKDVVRGWGLGAMEHFYILLFVFCKTWALCMEMLFSGYRLSHLWRSFIHRLVDNLGKLFAYNEFARGTSWSSYQICCTRGCRISYLWSGRKLITMLIFHNQLCSLRELFESLSFADHWRIVNCSMLSLLPFTGYMKL